MALVSIGQCLRVGLIAAAISATACSTASSRMWKASPQSMAQDYATINDTRSAGEVVVLMWFVPPMVRTDSPAAPNIKATLQKYVVIAAAHAHVDKATGTLNFDDIDSLQASDQTGKPLTLLSRDELPPSPAAMLVAIEGVFRQSLGVMGKGTKTFVFDAGSIDSCKKGQLSVPLHGETYTWSTPFPGCQ